METAHIIFALCLQVGLEIVRKHCIGGATRPLVSMVALQQGIMEAGVGVVLENNAVLHLALFVVTVGVVGNIGRFPPHVRQVRQYTTAVGVAWVGEILIVGILLGVDFVGF